jgi:hypothetical protein
VTSISFSLLYQIYCNCYCFSYETKLNRLFYKKGTYKLMSHFGPTWSSEHGLHVPLMWSQETLEQSASFYAVSTVKSLVTVKITVVCMGRNHFSTQQNRNIWYVSHIFYKLLADHKFHSATANKEHSNWLLSRWHIHFLWKLVNLKLPLCLVNLCRWRMCWKEVDSLLFVLIWSLETPFYDIALCFHLWAKMNFLGRW